MSEGFGARLRKQREERQIDLSWIAEQTKIKRSLLEALERDDVSRWPSGIFRRAYVRTYAHTIGLDPEVVLREFLEVYPEPVDMLEAAAAAAFEEVARRNAAGVRLRTIVDSALGSLARLRRPGAMDGSLPAKPPLAAPVRTVLGSRAVGPQSSPATLEDAAAREELPNSARAGCATPYSPDVPESVPGGQPADGTDETSADTSEAHATVPPDASVEPADDGHDQASAAGQNTDAWADAGSDEHHLSMYSRLEEVANLCTEFGRAADRDQILALLEDSARALDATGLILWLWDESAEALWPVLVHGYSEQVVARLPAVRRDADNATAEAFRSASACEVAPSAQATGALVLPLLIPQGCAGVLAVELQAGIQAPGSIRPLAVLLAAALAQFVDRSRPVPAARPLPALRSSVSVPLQ